MNPEAPVRDHSYRVRALRGRALLALALVIIAAEPFLFWNAFAGDAQVHLVFMESASQGRFFEFNPGETVSGETSPGYMMLGAGLFHLLPASSVPIALKILGLLAWYALCWLVYRVATRILDDEASRHGWPAIACFVAATLPGSVYNANVGMENGLFAAMIWGWLLLADRWRWFDGAVASLPRELIPASILGLACWVRPEGAVIALAAYAFRFTRRSVRFSRCLAGGLIVFMLAGASIAFQHAFTGDFVATSMLSRRILAMPNFVDVGPFQLDPTLARRLLIYFPITGLFIWGIRSVAGRAAPRERLLHLLVGTFFVIYSIAGAPQLARYLIFLMPALVIGAARGARAAWQKRTGRIIVAIAVLALVVLNLVELRLRRGQYSPALLARAVVAPARRHEYTERLLTDLGSQGPRPTVVATESVQIRYETDERIIVRSLDGRVDRALLAFARRDVVDHIGYIKARRVQFVLQLSSYNRNRNAWSLTELRRLNVGETLRRDGLEFQYLESGIGYAVAAQ